MPARLIKFLLEGCTPSTGDKNSSQPATSVALTAMSVPASVAMTANPGLAPMPARSSPINSRAAVDAGTACAAFLGYLQHEFGEGEMLWRYVFQCYCSLACDRGWPILSEKALSQGLSALGCTSRQRDLRGEGKGRPRELIWPGLARGAAGRWRRADQSASGADDIAVIGRRQGPPPIAAQCASRNDCVSMTA